MCPNLFFELEIEWQIEKMCSFTFQKQMRLYNDKDKKSLNFYLLLISARH